MRPSFARHKSITSSVISHSPIVRISGATFYEKLPSPKTQDLETQVTAQPLFPGLNFKLPSFSKPKQNWAVVSQSAHVRNLFLRILAGQLFAEPRSARSYPYLASEHIAKKNRRLQVPGNAFEYVNFGGDLGRHATVQLRGRYLGDRFESAREEHGLSVGEFLGGSNDINTGLEVGSAVDNDALRYVLHDLGLDELRSLSVKKLSNGQFRRALLAKALLKGPEVLLLDAPFLGLDPWSREKLHVILSNIVSKEVPRLVLSLAGPSEVPEWVTHLVHAERDATISSIGERKKVLKLMYKIKESAAKDYPLTSVSLRPYREKKRASSSSKEPRTPVVEMNGVRVQHQGRTILGSWKQKVDGAKKEGLWWKVAKGERWGLFGPNGSGKSTILSLITSDHPQSYAVPVQIFQKSRLPSDGSAGLSFFDLQRRVGHTSPELHAQFPKNLSVRETLESAWADAPLSKPFLKYEDDLTVDAHLRWFQSELDPGRDSGAAMTQPAPRKTGPKARLQATAAAAEKSLENAYPELSPDLDWADTVTLADLPASSQKVALFLRAIVRSPELVLLDEAFGGMDPHVRDRCLVFLEYGQEKEIQVCRDDGAGLTLRVLRSPLAVRRLVQVTGLKKHQTLISVAHDADDVPISTRDWLCLPQPGHGSPRFGRLEMMLRENREQWEQIWGRR